MAHRNRYDSSVFRNHRKSESNEWTEMHEHYLRTTLCLDIGTWAIRVVIAVAVITAVYYAVKWWYHGKRRDYGKYIGPEIGPWLHQSMINVGNRAAFAGPGKKFMLSEGGTWVTSGTKTDMPSDAKQVQSVRIFGQVVPFDVGGNITYGFIGRITNCGLSQLLLV